MRFVTICQKTKKLKINIKYSSNVFVPTALLRAKVMLSHQITTKTKPDEIQVQRKDGGRRPFHTIEVDLGSL